MRLPGRRKGMVPGRGDVPGRPPPRAQSGMVGFRAPCCCRGGAAYCEPCQQGRHDQCDGTSAGPIGAEDLARLFHETYERLAPSLGYQTRPESAVAWEDVPEDNRALMIATAAAVLEALEARGVLR